MFDSTNQNIRTMVVITSLFFSLLTHAEVPQLVKDVTPGSLPTQFTLQIPGGDKLYFLDKVAGNNTFTTDIWVTDGTESGTEIVAPSFFVNGGIGGQRNEPRWLAPINGELMFSQNSSSPFIGREFWVTDHIQGGSPQLLEDICAYDAVFDTNCSSPAPLFNGINQIKANDSILNINGTVFFRASDHVLDNDELWKTDGTTVGTVKVKEINSDITEGSIPQHFIDADGTLYFWAFDGVDSGLWKSDGTEAGTVLIKEFTSVFPSGTGFNDPGYTQVTYEPGIGEGGIYYFTFFNIYADGVLTYEHELWRTDGTEAGTFRLLHYEATQNGVANIGPQIALNGNVFFGAYDPLVTTIISEVEATDVTPATESKLLKSDGTILGTSVFDVPGSLRLFPQIEFNGELYLADTDKTLWKSDGTVSGTTVVKSLPSYPSEFVAGDELYFLQSIPNPDPGLRGYHSIWKTDGTEAGTVKVTSTEYRQYGGRYDELLNVGGTLFYHHDDEIHGEELWRLATIDDSAVPEMPSNLDVPQGPITDPTPLFRWLNTPGATSYELSIDDASGNIFQQVYTAIEVGCDGFDPWCSITPPIALVEGNGQWGVRGINAVGAGSWSFDKYFTYGFPPVQVNLIAPSGTVDDAYPTVYVYPTYVWDAIDGATSYRLEVERHLGASGHFTKQFLYTAEEAGCSNGSETCSAIPSLGAADGSNNRWRAYATSPFGDGLWSGYLNFNVVIEPASDQDDDGVLDENDNCTNASNADQNDADFDGYGNACDADLNNDNIVNFGDLGLLKSVFFSTVDPFDDEFSLEARSDLNGDGVVNFADLGILKSMFFQEPGPSCCGDGGGGPPPPF